MKSILFILIMSGIINAQQIINVENRNTTNLNGKWNIIIDPYENGYYNYRYEPNDNGYFKNTKESERWELLEYSFDTDEMLYVPGDWNSQKEKLLFYEGTIWYKKSFDYNLPKSKRLFIYFGAVNYDAKVYLNGEFLGHHEGGFTPFQFEITNKIKEKDNFVIVKVDNKRFKDAVPTVNTDWYNYGGITRNVSLVETEKTFINDYFIQLKKGSQNRIAGYIQLNGDKLNQEIKIEIPEAEVSEVIIANENGRAEFEFDIKLQLWSPENPKLYEVNLFFGNERLSDKIGFRNIETKGTEILLNGKPIYLKGISIHEEAPYGNGSRAFSKDHSKILLSWAKDLSCNFVRLAHYTHNESMLRTADEMGLLVWSEIPVYWTISWDNESTYKNAENQLVAMINRDKNRAQLFYGQLQMKLPYQSRDSNFFLTWLQKRKNLIRRD